MSGFIPVKAETSQSERFLEKSSERKINFAPPTFGEAAADENRSDARFEQCAESRALTIFRLAESFKRAARFIPAAEV